MPPLRVGTVDRPENYGARSVSVYENATGGLFITLDGLREKLHGNTRWHTLQGEARRGNSMAENAWADEERQQLEMAIANSLRDEPMSEPAEESMEEPADEPADAEPNINEEATTRACSICLQDASATMICKPCNHLVRGVARTAHILPL